MENPPLVDHCSRCSLVFPHLCPSMFVQSTLPTGYRRALEFQSKKHPKTCLERWFPSDFPAISRCLESGSQQQGPGNARGWWSSPWSRRTCFKDKHVMQSLNQSILGEYNTLGKRQTEQIYGPNGIHTKKTLANRRERELANKNGTATKVHISKN